MVLGAPAGGAYCRLTNLLWLFLSEGVSKAVAFLVVAYLAGELAPSGFGKLAFAQAVFAYFAILTGLGLDVVGSRAITGREDINEWAGVICLLRTLGAFCAFALLFALALFIAKDKETRTLCVLLGLSMFVVAFSLDWVFVGLGEARVVGHARIVQSVILGALVWTLVSGPDSLLLIPLCYLFAHACFIAVLHTALASRIGVVRPRFNLPMARRALLAGTPLAWSSLMIAVYYNFDMVVLGLTHDDSTIGAYGAARRLVLLLTGPAALIFTVFVPALAERHSSGTLKSDTAKYLRIMYGLGIPLGLGCSMLAPEAVEVVYGEKYGGAIWPLQMLGLNVLLVYINTAHGNPLLYWGRGAAYSKVITMAAVASALGAVLFVPRFGVTGAAIATIVAELTVFAGVYPEFRRQHMTRVMDYAVRPITGSILIAALAMVVRGASSSPYVVLFAAAVGAITVIIWSLRARTQAHAASVAVLYEPGK